MATLQLRELVVTDGLAPLSLTVPAGSITAVVTRAELGTALARVVVGLAAPISGEVHIGRREVTARPPGRRQIGYVPAGGALLPHLTVRQNVRYWQDRQAKQPVGVVQGRLEALLRDLELGRIEHERPHAIKDPETFRVALARACAGRPEALVVDRPEALGVADQLGDLIRRVSSPDALGAAVLVCTSDPAALSQVAKIVLFGEPPGQPDQLEPPEQSEPHGLPHSMGPREGDDR